MRGVHAEPFNQWLIEIDANWNKLMFSLYMVDRLAILQSMAQQTKGIGEVTVDTRLAIVEQAYATQ